MTSKCSEVNNNSPDVLGDATNTFAKMSLGGELVSPGKIITVDTCEEGEGTGRVTLQQTYLSDEKMTGKEINREQHAISGKTPQDRRVRVEKETRSSRRVRDRPRAGRGKAEKEGSTVHKDVAMKNAVMMLNEMFPPPDAPQYRVTSMTGTPNNPTFSMTCSILNQTFSGTGRSKKEAKLAASQQALQTLYGKDFSEGGGNEGSGNTSNPRSLSEIDSWLELEGKNPVSILNELYPGVIFQLVSAEGPSHAPQFCVRATLASLSYEGRGISKKEAKLHASKALLVHIHKVGFDPMTGNMKSGGEGQPDTIRAEGHSWADKVGGMVREQYNKLFDGTTYSKRKVMAGVVLDQAGVSTVICVSSGTKCINGEQLCLGGGSLNDCHAEVVARRCLLSWLYGQLELAMVAKTSVLQKDREGGFCLQQGVSLHLFVSTAPCGDARIFSLHEQPTNGSNCLTGYAGRPGEGNRGKLRSKIESGMGTVPLPEERRQQTWDGVISGERLLTMACSDKILKWNVVGVQGALLSHWLRPIYFSSITVGSRFHPEHVRRALYGRVGGAQDPALQLPPNYRLNCPPLLATTSPEARQASKAQEYSLNWVAGLPPEVVLGSTGKTTAGPSSRLCKQSLARSFVRICSLTGAMALAKPSLSVLDLNRIRNSMYFDIKQMARDYVVAKDQLVITLVERGAGRWVEKPVEQDQFYLQQWTGPKIVTLVIQVVLLLWNLTDLSGLATLSRSDFTSFGLCDLIVSH